MNRFSRAGTWCLAALMAAPLVAWISCRPNLSPTAPAPMLPPSREVDRITARCRDLVTDEFSPEFPVPAEYVDAVLRALGEPKPAEDLTPFRREVAVLRLHRRGGREMTIRLEFYGKEPARYSVDGVPAMRSGPYVGDTDFPLTGGSPRYSDEANILAVALSLMREQPIGDPARAEIRRLLAELDRSAGRTRAGAGPAPPPP